MDFHLGHLPTEQPHPETTHLSELVIQDPSAALQLLFKIDQQSWRVLKNSLGEIEKLRWSIQKTLQSQNRIFLCGCGATGRLSLSLDWLLKAHDIYSKNSTQPLNPQALVSFMAGGDSALVSALEGFEDYPELGKEHLQFMGFKNGDLLLSSSEGGETPYVLGATLYAAKHSSQKPWFLYCNPRELLKNTIPRSAEVLNHPQIHNLEIATGPMPLAGSTRMQASSVLMAALGLALFEEPKKWETLIENLIQLEKTVHQDHFNKIIFNEAQIYKNNNYSTYRIDRKSSITVFTDTTERAPTFSLNNFDHPQFRKTEHSLSYISIEETLNSEEAWLALLGRKPITLNRPDLSSKSTFEYLEGFDFSQKAVQFRKDLIPDHKHIPIFVQQKQDHWNFEVDGTSLKIPLTESLLINHLNLKTTLNIHSTLMMGHLGRYTGNLMTYVKPTNGKLIDRSVRYVLSLLKKDGISINYQQVLTTLKDEIPKLKSDEPIVLKVYKILKT
ncbi:MAG TPA: hypothetical protein PLJ21_03660 [Pseudobdellovibrionaceae bacterium]|nr:hypothetical protein [Pseudobdellovibrionaceae bacterium]